MFGWVEKLVISTILDLFAKGQLADVMKALKVVIDTVGSQFPAVKGYEQVICCWLYAQSKATQTGIDDALVQAIAGWLGVDLSKCPTP